MAVVEQKSVHDPMMLVEQKAGEVAETLLVSERFVQLFLFGSRATGRAVPRSDIDIGLYLGHPVSPEVLAAIREAFDELPILQKVDVVDFATVDDAFKVVALQQTRNLYEREAA